MRLTRNIACLAVVLATAGTLTSAVTAHAAGPMNYVAMGDSVAAAPGVPDPAAPAGCLKSTNNYPSRLARRIAATSFKDVSCTGALSEYLTRDSQQTPRGPVPPQIDAIGSDTDLITITIGGNDVHLEEIARQCKKASPQDQPCKDEFVHGGFDTISAAIIANVPEWATLIDAVRAKAPQARIIWVGYPTYIRPGGCFLNQPHSEPITATDADYFQAKVDEIDFWQQQVAAYKGIEYFDTRPLTVGHDMCAPQPDERYIEGFKVAHPAAPLHPNALGSAAMGDAIAEHIG